MKRSQQSERAKLIKYQERLPPKRPYQVGLDISLNSPGLTIKGPNGVQCFFWRQRVREAGFRYEDDFCSIECIPYDLKDPKHVRVRKVASGIRYALGNLDPTSTNLFMEDLAYGAANAGCSSSLTQLAGIAEVVKYVVDDMGFDPPYQVSPPTLKRMFSGHGLSKKDDMYRAWLENGGPDLLTIFKVKRADQKPVEDIVDSYGLARFPEDLQLAMNEIAPPKLKRIKF